MSGGTVPDKTSAVLDQISYLSLELEDVQKAINILAENANHMEATDDAIEVIRRLLYGVIRCMELGKKTTKKFIPSYIGACQRLKSSEKVIDALYQTLISLPMMLASRWDILGLLGSARIITTFDEVLFVEVMSCAPDQDLASRCSSTVLAMASNPESAPRIAKMIYTGLTSPVYSVRNNVHRSWLSRIISSKASQKRIEEILKLCQFDVTRQHNDGKMWPVAFREICGLTCVDLEWKAVLDEEPYDALTFSLLAYFAVLIALKNTSSQIHVAVKVDDVVVAKGIEYFGAVAAKQAFIVCQKYKICPQGLERAILCEMSSSRNPDIYDIIDEDLLQKLTEDTQVKFTKEKLRLKMERQKTHEAGGKKPAENEPKREKFYPAEDDGCLKVEVKLHAEAPAQQTVDRFLKVQHPTQEYPSVAAVMEHLSLQNIDERLFCQKIIIISDIIRQKFTERQFSRKTYTELVFKMVTRIPLRSVVDYVGAQIKAECFKEFLIREKIFKMACDLMILDDENARPLSLYHCFISTCYLETEKVKHVWRIVRSLKSGIKMRKMAEMLAKVVTSSEIKVETDVLHDMILCSLGVHRRRFDGESTQLFVAAVSKLLDFRNENERAMLFQVISDTPEVVEVIQNILCHNVPFFSDAAFQMVLFFFTRFHIGAIEFYTQEQIPMIARIINFCHWCIRKFAGEPMMLSIAVDAICGFLPWSYLREKALLKAGEYDDLEDPVEKLIIQNLRHNRLCVLLAEHNKEDKLMTIEDFEQLPKAKFIVEILKNKDNGSGYLNSLAKQLVELVKSAKGFEDIHAVWLAYGILSDKALEMIDDAELYKDMDPDYKKRYPSRALMESLIDVGAGFDDNIADLRMANSWLDKGLGKIQILTDREFCLDDCPR